MLLKTWKSCGLNLSVSPSRSNDVCNALDFTSLSPLTSSTSILSKPRCALW